MEQADVCDKLSKEEKDRLLKQTDVCCLTKGSSFRPTNDVAALLETLDFATRKHSTQRRKDPEKTPYINHPIGVAHILASEGGVTNLEVLQGALLHDTVEDTDTTLDEIEMHFGSSIRRIVEEVTDNKALSYQEKKLHQIARAPFVSFEAKLVKLGDKLHNLRDLLRTTPEGWTEQRVLAYFHWAAQVVQGILGTNAALEEQIRQVLAVRGVILPEELPAFFLPVSSLPVPPSGPS